jgi:hypothetical protein
MHFGTRTDELFQDEEDGGAMEFPKLQSRMQQINDRKQQHAAQQQQQQQQT